MKIGTCSCVKMVDFVAWERILNESKLFKWLKNSGNFTNNTLVFCWQTFFFVYTFHKHLEMDFNAFYSTFVQTIDSIQ